MRERFFPLSICNWFWTVLVCSFCTVLGACSAGKFLQKPSAKPPEAVSAQPPVSAPPLVSTQPEETARVMYYVGVDQLAMYSEPQPSSSLLTRLPLYQKVYRYKMEKGYAYIKVEGNGVTGWVDNAQLIWRLPARQQKASPKPEEQMATPTSEAPTAPDEAPPPTTAAEAAEPELPPTTIETPTEQKPTSPTAAPTSVSPVQSVPAAPSAPRAITPSIFNPY